MHCCQDVFQFRLWKSPDIDSTYAMIVLEYRNDVNIMHSRIVPHASTYGDRQRWPDVQLLNLQWNFGVVKELETQTTR